MCTAFVYKGNDRICGFNMDLPDVLDWKLFMDAQAFYVGIRPNLDSKSLPEGMTEIPAKYMPCQGEYIKIHGVNNNGDFGNQLNALNFTKAPFTFDDDAMPLYSIVDRFLSGISNMEDILDMLNHNRIVNLPSGTIDLPDIALHSLLSDKEGRILMIEPGNGHAEIKDNYAVMSNFPMLILPNDLMANSTYYGLDRYETAVRMIEEANQDITPEYALSILEAVKQTMYAPTKISFVYSEKENKVYYCLNGDFNNIQTHKF